MGTTDTNDKVIEIGIDYDFGIGLSGGLKTWSSTIPSFVLDAAYAVNIGYTAGGITADWSLTRLENDIYGLFLSGKFNTRSNFGEADIDTLSFGYNSGPLGLYYGVSSVELVEVPEKYDATPSTTKNTEETEFIRYGATYTSGDITIGIDQSERQLSGQTDGVLTTLSAAYILPMGVTASASVNKGEIYLIEFEFWEVGASFSIGIGQATLTYMSGSVAPASAWAPFPPDTSSISLGVSF